LTTFGNTVKRIIFSVFSQLPIHERVTDYSTKQFKKYYDRLYESKEEYAKLCEAEFTVLKPSIDDYVDLQHYKIIALEELAQAHDEVLYLDFDVVPKTSQNIFETFNLDKICILNENTNTIIQKEIENYQHTEWKDDFKKSIGNYKQFVSQKLQRDHYHRCSKAFMKRQMLFNDDIISYDEHIVNTGIIAGNKKSISLLKYRDRLEDMKTISELDNNEIFFSYLLEKYDIPFTNIGYDWHRVYDNLDIDLDNFKMVHVINKRFEDIW
jgi:hypothetical protein